MICLIICNLLIIQTQSQCAPSSGQILIGGFCKRVCPNDYYLNPATYLCVSCGTGCSFCADGTACLTCNSATYFRNQVTNRCVTTCPDGTFTNSGSKICEACVTTNCKTCAFSKSVCHACNPTFYLTPTNTCESNCPANYWNKKDTLTCDACPSNCSACPLNGKICTACEAGFKLFDEDCVATCPDRTFEDGPVCTLCEGKCATCTSTTECTKCSSGYFLSGSDCVINCNDHQTATPDTRGYYNDYLTDANAPRCTFCNADCKSCLNASVCNECISSKKLQNGSCVDSCSDGYYLSGTNCLPCIESNCKTCSNVSCTECTNGYALKDNNCYAVASCPTGFYAGVEGTISKCLACHANCAACTGSQKTSCTQCKFQNFLDGTTCDSTCPNGKYGDLTDSQCKNCDTTCSKCTSLAKCTECSNTFHLLNSKCVTECGEGYIENSGICQACNVAKCKDCDADISKCTTCFEGHLKLGDDKCVQPCPTNFYLNGDNDCTACDVTAGNVWCKPPCGDGKYADFSRNECEVCKDECSKCTSATSCDECKASNYFIADKNDCVSTCPRGYLNDDSTSPKTCKKCDTGCAECSTTFDNCTACEKHFYYVAPYTGQSNGKCYEVCLDGSFFNRTTYQCTDCLTNCKDCADTAICLQCKDSHPYLQNNATECKDTCPQGSFGNAVSKKCESCESNCKVCTDATTCTECNDGFFLNGGDCVATCPTRKFGDVPSKACVDCGANCLVCTSAAVCTECGDGKFLKADGTCVTTCPDTFFGNTTTMACAACGTDCKTCQNAEVCTVCTSPKVLFLDFTCKESCGDEFFPNASGVCAKCDSSCQKCTAQSTCQECNENSFLQGTTCGATCPDGKYAASEDRTCKACDASCSKCTGAKNCSECATGFLINNSCPASCPQGYYGDIGSKQCKLCSTGLSNCKACASSSACSECNLTYFLNTTSQCVANCDDGFFENVANGNCTACDANCKTCTDSATRCDSCVGWKLLFNYTCVNPCPEASAYLNPSKMCENCSPGCTGSQTCKPPAITASTATTWTGTCQSPA